MDPAEQASQRSPIGPWGLIQLWRPLWFLPWPQFLCPCAKPGQQCGTRAITSSFSFLQGSRQVSLHSKGMSSPAQPEGERGEKAQKEVLKEGVPPPVPKVPKSHLQSHCPVPKGSQGRSSDTAPAVLQCPWLRELPPQRYPLLAALLADTDPVWGLPWGWARLGSHRDLGV